MGGLDKQEGQCFGIHCKVNSLQSFDKVSYVSMVQFNTVKGSLHHSGRQSFLCGHKIT